jgi:hypothetical protein
MIARRMIFCLQVWANQSLLSRAPALSCFYSTPGRGKTTVRFAFAKKLETLGPSGSLAGLPGLTANAR